MRYADPSANRDLLGNRTLLFIFICAFALVTLLQQILYGSNYIKRGLQFGWQSGDQLANWTGLFNVTDDQAVQSGSDSSSRYFEFYEGPFEYNSTRCLELRHEILEVKVLSMVKQSELFDRWKSLQMCKWALNISEANQFKSTLSRCCNAPAFLFTTQKNTPLGTKLKYEVDTSGIYHINQEIFRMFPKDMPYYRSQFKKCAVVGNGGILKNSRCGREINSADFVFRCNLPPISEKYTMDVGVKTDVVTVNPSIITERFHKLEKWRRPFYRVLQVYENASVLLPAFYNTRNTDVSIRVKSVPAEISSISCPCILDPLPAGPFCLGAPGACSPWLPDRLHLPGSSNLYVSSTGAVKRTIWTQSLLLLLSGYVTLGELSEPLETRIHHLKNKDRTPTSPAAMKVK
ncbi:alpha-2,8-sialyltransferase 8E isoform X2 [Cynocephalus volans]|uniref:alpha-2,8-sialyltransferase 8E isoform X2 n=1 Tax=Cynocephalus volans TaxID=110931 RepID=UPI002FC7B4DC